MRIAEDTKGPLPHLLPPFGKGQRAAGSVPGRHQPVGTLFQPSPVMERGSGTGAGTGGLHSLWRQALLMCACPLLVLYATAAGRTQTSPGTSWERMGIVISSTLGLPDDKPLKYAYRDGERMFGILTSMGKVPEGNLFLVQTENPGEVRGKLKTIAERITAARKSGKKIFVQLYYSGHGASSHFHIGGERIAFSEIKSLLNAEHIDARVFILDVCFGASFFAAKGFKTAQSVPVEVRVDDLTKGEVIITSSALNEQSYEVKPLEGSIFTSHWLMALRGAGDKDRDGQVSLFEAYNYTYHKTVAYSSETLNRPQHPSYDMQLRGGKDLMLTRPRELASGILFQDCPGSNYSITDLKRKLSIGEVYLSGEGNFSLALEPGNYEVRYLPQKKSPKSATIEVASSELTPLSFTSFRHSPVTLALAKGDSAVHEEAAAPQPRVEHAPSVRPRTPDRLGPLALGKQKWRGVAFSFLMGEAYSREFTLMDDLNEQTAVKALFHLRSNAEYQAFQYFRGIMATVALTRGFFAGGKLLFGNRSITSQSTGREPLNSQTSFPVTLNESYRFNSTVVGPFLGAMPFIWKKHALGMDGGYYFIHSGLETEWKLERPLYDVSEEKSGRHTGKGYRMDAGLTYSRLFPGLFGLLTGEVSLRAGFYYQNIETIIKGASEALNKTIHSDEAGVSGTIMFSLANFFAN